MGTFGRCLTTSMVVGATVAGTAVGGYGASGDLLQLGYQLVNQNSRKCLTVLS